LRALGGLGAATLRPFARMLAPSVGATAGLAKAAAVELRFAVVNYGFSSAAVVYLGRRAYTFYLRNAVTINEAVAEGKEIALDLAGADTGPISPGDTLSFAVKQVDKSQETWKVVDAEVIDVAAEQVRANIRRVQVGEPINVANEFDSGKMIHHVPHGIPARAKREGIRAAESPEPAQREVKLEPAPTKQPASGALKEIPQSGTRGSRQASAKASAQQEAKSRPTIPESPRRKKMIDALMDEHPGLHRKTASDAVEGAIQVEGKDGRSIQGQRQADVKLAGGVRREVTVLQEDMKLENINRVLINKASQGLEVREIYIQVNIKGASRRQVRSVMNGLRRGLIELPGIRVRVYGPNGKIWWQGRFPWQGQDPL
jgi:hypothetical protein